MLGRYFLTHELSLLMFGAFRATNVNLGGLLWYVPKTSLWTILNCMFLRKVPWKLSLTRKANARARLKKVDAVIEAVRVSGVKCSALVRRTFPLSHSKLVFDAYCTGSGSGAAKGA